MNEYLSEVRKPRKPRSPVFKTRSAHGSAAPKLGCPRRLGARRGRLVLRIGLIFARLLSVGCEQQALLDRHLMVSIGIRHGDIEAAGNARDRSVSRVGSVLLQRVLEVLTRLEACLVDLLLRIRLDLRHILLGDGGCCVMAAGE